MYQSPCQDSIKFVPKPSSGWGRSIGNEKSNGIIGSNLNLIYRLSSVQILLHHTDQSAAGLGYRCIVTHLKVIRNFRQLDAKRDALNGTALSRNSVIQRIALQMVLLQDPNRVKWQQVAESTSSHLYTECRLSGGRPWSSAWLLRLPTHSGHAKKLWMGP